MPIMTFRIGDRIKTNDGMSGVVVCNISYDEYTSDDPKEAWSWMGEGIVVLTEEAGLVRYTAFEGLEIIASEGPGAPQWP
jgi:hypothetical protein